VDTAREAVVKPVPMLVHVDSRSIHTQGLVGRDPERTPRGDQTGCQRNGQ
jgi:hypothetical protein